MNEPQIGHEYELHKTEAGGKTSTARFVRFADGSATVEAHGFVNLFELTPSAWHDALTYLRNAGFEIPSVWNPSENLG